MAGLYAKAYVWVDGKRALAEALIADAELRNRANLAANPAGGVEIGDDSDYLLIDDAVGFVAADVMEAAPAALRAGQRVVYVMRLSRDSMTIEVEDGLALAGEASAGIVTAPVEEMAAALEAGHAEYRALMEAVGQTRDLPPA